MPRQDTERIDAATLQGRVPVQSFLNNTKEASRSKNDARNTKSHAETSDVQILQVICVMAVEDNSQYTSSGKPPVNNFSDGT